jgi:acetyl esterase/lipase
MKDNLVARSLAFSLLCISIVACCFWCTAANGQLRTGLTAVRDTSYTSYSAYISARRHNPAIKLVKAFHYADVRKEMDIVYRTIGTRELLIDVFTPAQQGTARTAVIMIHGGGWRSGSRTQHYPMAERLAHLGYVCFTPEYRLSTEALFPASVYDIKAAIRWVRVHASAYHVDTSRIVIAGFSSGGEMAAFMATTGDMPLFDGPGANPRVSTEVDALIDIDGILTFTGPESGESTDTTGRISAGTYWLGYNEKQNPGLWIAASPLTYVSARTPPTLFVNSSVARMHAGRDAYISMLSRYHVYTEVHHFDDAPHSFPLFYPWFDPMMDDIDGFLRKVFP